MFSKLLWQSTPQLCKVSHFLFFPSFKFSIPQWNWAAPLQKTSQKTQTNSVRTQGEIAVPVARVASGAEVLAEASGVGVHSQFSESHLCIIYSRKTNMPEKRDWSCCNCRKVYIAMLTLTVATLKSPFGWPYAHAMCILYLIQTWISRITNWKTS